MNTGPINQQVPGIITGIVASPGTWRYINNNPATETACSAVIGLQRSGGNPPSGVGTNTFYSDFDSPFGDNSGTCEFTITYIPN